MTFSRDRPSDNERRWRRFELFECFLVLSMSYELFIAGFDQSFYYCHEFVMEIL